MIYGASVLINDLFGWSVLLITVSYFLDCVGNGYLYVLLITDSSSPVKNGVGISIGIALAAVAFSSLCYSCGRCVENVSTLINLIS